MKTGLKIAAIVFLMASLLALLTCVQTEQGTTPSKPSSEKKAPAKKPPVKIKYLTGEIVSVHKTQKTVIVKTKDAEALLHTDGKTIIKVNEQPGTISDLAAGMKATVRYVELKDRDMAKSILVSPPAPPPSAPPPSPAAQPRPLDDKKVSP